MNEDKTLYFKAIVLVATMVFSLSITIYYIDQYFIHKLHESYLASCDDSTYDKDDEEINLWVKTSATLKKDNFKRC